ncbi:MAG: hypothetical protein SFT91_01670 [Rickettsiaceae bacterium]|nr:hypothetical protein [Rickettsiaceae bacterium]
MPHNTNALTNFVNTPDSAGVHPIIKALKFGFIDLAKELIEDGARVDAKDSEGNTTLNLALSIGDDELVQIILRSAELQFGSEETSAEVEFSEETPFITAADSFGIEEVKEDSLVDEHAPEAPVEVAETTASEEVPAPSEEVAAEVALESKQEDESVALAVVEEALKEVPAELAQELVAASEAAPEEKSETIAEASSEAPVETPAPLQEVVATSEQEAATQEVVCVSSEAATEELSGKVAPEETNQDVIVVSEVTHTDEDPSARLDVPAEDAVELLGSDLS